MNEIDHFQQVTASLGGRFAIEQCAPEAASAFATIVERARAYIASAAAALPNMPPIYFDLVNTGEVNAWASAEDYGRHIIGLSTGACYVIVVVFNRMLADSRVLTHVGDPSRGASDLPPLAGFTAHAQDLFDLGHVPIRPKDSARRLYAAHLRDLALDYLVGHELTHIANGHTGYWRKRSRHPAIAEMGARPTDAAEGLLLQTIEMDADSGAASSAIESVRDKMSSKKPAPPPWDTFYQSHEQAFFDWAFAACIVDPENWTTS